MIHGTDLKLKHRSNSLQVLTMRMADRQTGSHASLIQANNETHLRTARHTLKHERTRDFKSSSIHTNLIACMVSWCNEA
jgi:hypothetical protein